MKFMLDSASLKEIEEVKNLGLLEGLTTNPLIIQKGLKETGYSGDFFDYAKRIMNLTKEKPTFFQVASFSEKEIIADAKTIYEKLKPYGNVHIKVPIDTSQNTNDSKYEGLKAIRRLSKENIPILATAIVTPVQAFLASKAGAKYAVLMLRPYDNVIAERLSLKELGETGYLDNESVSGELTKKGETLDAYLSGLDILERTSKIFKNQKLETKLIIAGIRNPVQVSAVLEREGPSAMTLPYNVFVSLFSHEGTKRFVRDTYKAGDKDSAYGRFLRNEK